VKAWRAYRRLLTDQRSVFVAGATCARDRRSSQLCNHNQGVTRLQGSLYLRVFPLRVPELSPQHDAAGPC
jgi:hypothetical protein